MKIVQTLIENYNWEPLAAALGNQPALASASSTLTFDDVVPKHPNIVVERKDGSARELPSNVCSLIDGLHLGNHQKLMECIGTWPKPVKIKDHRRLEFMWLRVLRFLKTDNPVILSGMKISALENEIDVLWHSERLRRLEWDDVPEYLKGTHLQKYDSLRKLDTADLDLSSVSPSDVNSCDPVMFRLFRNRTHTLREDAISSLRNRVFDGVDRNQWWTILGLETLVEIKDPCLDELENMVAEKISGAENPASKTYMELCMVTGSRKILLP